MAQKSLYQTLKLALALPIASVLMSLSPDYAAAQDVGTATMSQCKPGEDQYVKTTTGGKIKFECHNVKKSKGRCADQFNGNGMCMPQSLREVLSLSETLSDYCPGNVDYLCTDAENVPAFQNGALSQEELQKLREKDEELGNAIAANHEDIARIYKLISEDNQSNASLYEMQRLGLDLYQTQCRDELDDLLGLKSDVNTALKAYLTKAATIKENYSQCIIPTEPNTILLNDRPWACYAMDVPAADTEQLNQLRKEYGTKLSAFERRVSEIKQKGCGYETPIEVEINVAGTYTDDLDNNFDNGSNYGGELELKLRSPGLAKNPKVDFDLGLTLDGGYLSVNDRSTSVSDLGEGVTQTDVQKVNQRRHGGAAAEFGLRLIGGKLRLYINGGAGILDKTSYLQTTTDVAGETYQDTLKPHHVLKLQPEGSLGISGDLVCSGNEIVCFIMGADARYGPQTGLTPRIKMGVEF